MGRPHRPSPTEPAGTAGYTLLEVLLATMLACVMVTAVFSVSLTARRDAGKNDRRLLANQIARTLSSRLQNYVSGCCNSSGCNGAGGSASCGALAGPNTHNVNSWSLTDTVTGVTDSMGGVYAFQAGKHNITGTGLIPAFFGGPPYNAVATYTVGAFGNGSAPVITVPVQVLWTEPNEK